MYKILARKSPVLQKNSAQKESGNQLTQTFLRFN